VRIAHIALADKYAAATLGKAEQQLRNVEEVYARKSDKKSVEAAAREVVGTAEEARVMAVKQKAEEDAQAKIAADKKAAEEREAKAEPMPPPKPSAAWKPRRLANRPKQRKPKPCA